MKNFHFGRMGLYCAVVAALSCLATSTTSGADPAPVRGVLFAAGYNASGQTGLGAATSYSTFTAPAEAWPVIAAAAGDAHSLFVKADGTVYAMGLQASGRLGDGVTLTNGEVHAPKKITALSGVVAVATGTGHSLFLKADGTVWGVGANNNGELAQGNYDSPKATPVRIGGITDPIAVAACNDRSFVLQRDGTLLAMGKNPGLGLDVASGVTAPLIVATGVTSIAAGFEHSLFVKADGSLWGMGNDDKGRLGIEPASGDRKVPVKILDSGVAGAACGGFHSAIYKTDGTLWTMGTNTAGALGIGYADNTMTHTLTQVTVPGGARVVAVAAGKNCTYFITNDRVLYGMGEGSYGRFGNGQTVDYSSPTALATNVFACVANGRGEHALILEYPIPPSITTQPAAKSITSGQSTTLTVAAIGTAPLAYQWYTGLSGDTANPIAGATNASFTTPALTATTSYWVRASNGAVPDADSQTATVTVAVPPAITQQTQAATIDSGQSAALSVTTAGTAPLTYQWYLGAKGTTTQPIAGATGASFTTPPLAASGSYWVRIANTAGTVDSETIAVTVRVPPFITAYTTGRTATIGMNLSLSVTAEGTAPLAYQWFRGGRRIAGATGSSLDLASFEVTQAGIYDVLVSGTKDVLSRPAVVGVVLPSGTRTAGAVTTRDEWQNIHHPNGAIYDQFLLTGAAGTFSADPNEIARCSYLDENESIVQVEMSGAGAITIVLDPTTAAGPMAPALYNQSGIQYMKGKATIVLAGSDATTHFTIYSVGTATNPGVTRPDVPYAGWADVAASGIVSANTSLGGIHQGNVNYNAALGCTGLYAPTIGTVGGLVVVHGVTASADAVPYLYFGLNGSVSVKIAGSSLAQPNGDVITVQGLAEVSMGAGQDSCGRGAPAQQIATRLVTDAGSDVTGSTVVGP